MNTQSNVLSTILLNSSSASFDAFSSLISLIIKKANVCWASEAILVDTCAGKREPSLLINCLSKQDEFFEKYWCSPK